MTVDSSALVAILRQEPEGAAFSEVIAKADRCRISAVSWVETAVVMGGDRDPLTSRDVDELMADAGIEIMPVTVEQAQMARAAYRDFGKGSGHPARLNFGDCFAYALAQWLREPLLYKGEDFGHTDVRPALPRP